MKRLLIVALSAMASTGCSLRPVPLEPLEIQKAAKLDGEAIAKSEDPVTGSIDLAHATARAVKYNLQFRVQLMQEALAERSFELARMDMLPVMAAGGNYSARDSFNASSSQNVITHQQSLADSYSEDRTRLTADIRFSWNILDFGISYLQAAQESNRYLVAVLARRKAMEKLVQQVRTAYWRAAALQQVSPEVDRLLDRAQKALDNLKQVRDEKLRAPLATLQDTRALTEIVQQLEALRESVNAAQVDLSQLINIRPHDVIKLVIPDKLPILPNYKPDFEHMEDLALLNSSDYAAELYNFRIDRDESRKALLRLMPGVEMFASSDYDSNSFLFKDVWQTVGAHVTWNIARLASLPDILDNNEARDNVGTARRLAAHMGVITKVHLAWQNYVNVLARLSRAEDVDALDAEIATLTTQALESEAASGILDLKSCVGGLRSKVAKVLAYADAQDGFAQFLQALGLHPVPDDYQLHSVDELALSIDKAFDRFSSGDLPDLPAPPVPEAAKTPDAAVKLAATDAGPPVIVGPSDMTVKQLPKVQE